MNETRNFILSSYSGLTWDLYTRMVFAILCILTNIINICVFLNPKLKDITYKYMLINSITNVIYMALSCSSVLFYYCNECPSSQTYLSALFSIIFTFYIFDCLKLFHIIIQIIISMRIYLILLNNTHKANSYKRILTISATLTMAFFIQEPFSFEIFTRRNQFDSIVFHIRANEFGKSVLGRSLVIAQFSTRIFLAVFVLGFINILSVIEFRKRFNHRNHHHQIFPVSFIKSSKCE